MGQTTLRIDDDLLKAIEEATDSETTRSEWVREAIRLRLGQDQSVEERLEELELRVEEIEQWRELTIWQRVLR